MLNLAFAHTVGTIAARGYHAAYGIVVAGLDGIVNNERIICVNSLPHGIQSGAEKSQIVVVIGCFHLVLLNSFADSAFRASSLFFWSIRNDMLCSLPP